MRTAPVKAALAALVLLGLLTGLVACGGDDGGGGGGGGAGGETVTIGSLHPLTGALAADGKAMDTAVKMAVEDINRRGGIKALDGAKLEVQSEDTQGEPETGQAAAQRMADQGVAAMIGTFQSAVTTNVATVAARSQVPLVIDVAVADEILQGGNQFVFRIQPNATAMGEYGARFLRQLAETTGETVRTVAYMRDESEFGTSVFQAFRQEAQKQGIRVVKDIPYDPFATQDFTTALAQAEAARPDVLVVTGYYPDGVQIAKNAMSVEPSVKAVYGVANGAFSLETFTKDAGEAGNLYFDSNYHWDGTKERVKEIRAAFEQRTGEPMRTAAVLSYQAVEVIARALEQAGSSEPADVREALAQVSVDDPLLTFPGPIEFNERGENVNAQPSLMQVQDGEIVQVLPERFREREPEFPGVPWSR